VSVAVARVYDDVTAGAIRVLVDRLWPRGISKQDAPFDYWAKEVAPSTELRRWYGHLPDRFEEFSRRYREELSRGPAAEALEGLRVDARSGSLILLTATKDLDLSGAAVLERVLSAAN
jgi:uncharacterized protein YeaO (DUF488 family)